MKYSYTPYHIISTNNIAIYNKKNNNAQPINYLISFGWKLRYLVQAQGHYSKKRYDPLENAKLFAKWNFTRKLKVTVIIFGIWVSRYFCNVDSCSVALYGRKVYM
jgi:hypothetical protein